MTFMLWSHTHTMMELKMGKSSIIENCMFWVTGPACTGNMTSPRKAVVAPLNPNNIRLGFSRADGRSPISYRLTPARGQLSYPDRSKLFLRRTHLSLVSGLGCLRVAAKPDWLLLAERWLCRPLGWHSLPVSYVGWSWYVPLWRLREATFAFFVWNCIFHQRGLREYSW